MWACGGLTALVGGYEVEGFRDLLQLGEIVTAIALGPALGTSSTTPGRRAEQDL